MSAEHSSKRIRLNSSVEDEDANKRIRSNPTAKFDSSTILTEENLVRRPDNWKLGLDTTKRRFPTSGRSLGGALVGWRTGFSPKEIIPPFGESFPDLVFCGHHDNISFAKLTAETVPDQRTKMYQNCSLCLFEPGEANNLLQRELSRKENMTHIELEQRRSAFDEARSALLRNRGNGLGTRAIQEMAAERIPWMAYVCGIWRRANMVRRFLARSSQEDGIRQNDYDVIVNIEFKAFVNRCRNRNGKLITMYCGAHQKMGDFLPSRPPEYYDSCGICVKMGVNVSPDEQQRLMQKRADLDRGEYQNHNRSREQIFEEMGKVGPQSSGFSSSARPVKTYKAEEFYRRTPEEKEKVVRRGPVLSMNTRTSVERQNYVDNRNENENKSEFRPSAYDLPYSREMEDVQEEDEESKEENMQGLRYLPSSSYDQRPRQPSNQRQRGGRGTEAWGRGGTGTGERGRGGGGRENRSWPMNYNGEEES